MATAQEIIDAVIVNTPELNGNVPLVRAASLQETGGAILNYQPYMNAFINTLVNRIMYQDVKNRVYENPLKIFKGNNVPYGTDVQETIANPAVATAYDPSALNDILTPVSPDVKTVYYRRNRQDKYKTTVYDEQLKGAFLGEVNFGNFISMLRSTLISGDNIDEFNLMKGAAADAIDDGNVNTSVIDATGTTEEFAKDLVRAARTKFLQFQFASSAYNKYKAMATAAGVTTPTDLVTWSDPDKIAVIMRADIASIVDVDSLAAAFNMSKADFLGRQIIIDTFGSGTTSAKTGALICDMSTIRAWDNMYKMTNTEYNAAALCRSYYLHHWETIAFSPIANAWAFQTEA